MNKYYKIHQIGLKLLLECQKYFIINDFAYFFCWSQDDDADGEEEGEEEVKRAHKTSIGEMFSVREDQVSQMPIRDLN